MTVTFQSVNWFIACSFFGQKIETIWSTCFFEIKKIARGTSWKLILKLKVVYPIIVDFELSHHASSTKLCAYNHNPDLHFPYCQNFS